VRDEDEKDKMKRNRKLEKVMKAVQLQETALLQRYPSYLSYTAYCIVPWVIFPICRCAIVTIISSSSSPSEFAVLASNETSQAVSRLS
jgi:hypothetical protein